MLFEVVISPGDPAGKGDADPDLLVAVVDEPQVEPDAEDARGTHIERAVSENPEAEVDVVGELPDGLGEEEVAAHRERSSLLRMREAGRGGGEEGEEGEEGEADGMAHREVRWVPGVRAVGSLYSPGSQPVPVCTEAAAAMGAGSGTNRAPMDRATAGPIGAQGPALASLLGFGEERSARTGPGDTSAVEHTGEAAVPGRARTRSGQAKTRYLGTCTESPAGGGGATGPGITPTPCS